MSIWSTVKNDVFGRNVNEKMLEAALQDLGIGLNKSVKSIRNSWGHETVDAALTKNGKITSMGIKWTKNKGVEFVGDTFNCNFGHGIGDKGQEQLTNKVAQAYQTRYIKYMMQMNNWSVVEQKDVNGKIKLTLVQA